MIMYMEQVLLSGIQQALEKTFGEVGVQLSPGLINFEHPADPAHGDYATSCVLSIFSLYKTDQAFKAQFSSPRACADYCVQKIENYLSPELSSQIKSLSVAGPGFINITLSIPALVTTALDYIQSKPIKHSNSSRHCLIEYVSPNTNKPLHIGHLRNAALGTALANLFEKNGWQVTRAIEYNDRGLHIMKSVWGYLLFGRKLPSASTEEKVIWYSELSEWMLHQEKWLSPEDSTADALRKSDHFVGYWYQRADQSVGDSAVEAAWAEMLRAWEEESDPHHENIRMIWRRMNTWFYEGYQQTAERFGFSFDADAVNYESEIYMAGKDIVMRQAATGVFEKLADGAVVAHLEQFKLPDKILLRRDGTGIYMTFDIELTRRRSTKNAEKMIWVVGMDQKLYFQQLFAIAELLGYGKRETFFHFAYGMVRLPEGKMSSRKGTAIYGDDLMDSAREQAAVVLKEAAVAKSLSSEELASIVEKMGIAAIKWTMLSQDPQSEITFNVSESVSIKGFSGPYVQYTFARTQSILAEVQKQSIAIDFDSLLTILMSGKVEPSPFEIDVLRSIYIYKDAIARAAEEYAPHGVCQYLFTLSQKYNALYAELPIITAPEFERQLRLCVTQAVGTVLSDGLKLLGIASPERM